jgi:hypothetical protein
MPEDFPPDIKRFIEGQIESLAQLEGLLLMRKEPQRQWTASEIAKSLYLPPEMGASLLDDFSRRGFVHELAGNGKCYSYRSIDAETDNLIDQLAAIYHERRVAVISLIYSKPLNKVQTFADAFRLRKES